MSIAEFGSISALSGGIVNVTSGHTIKGQAGSILTTGSIIQMGMVRNDTRPSYYNYVQGNDQQNYTTVGTLKLPFRPMYANSLVLVKFVIRVETEYNCVWTITKDEAGMMNIPGEVFTGRFNGFAAQPYDMGDNSSTPNNITMMWMDIPGTTDTVTYAPAFKRSDGGGITVYINRTTGSSGQWNYENGVSMGVCWEIAQ